MSCISREDCHVIIQNKLKTSEFNLISFTVTSLRDVSGYLGQYHKLQIQVSVNEAIQTINCFIKSPPKDGILLDFLQELNGFSREIFMYEVLIPRMEKYDINIITECLPPSYLQRHDDVIVFEDMTFLNYQNLDVLKPLDFHYLEIVFKKLAKFHACSLLLEEKISEELQKPYRLSDTYGDFFKDTLFIEEGKFFKTAIKSVPVAVDLFPELKTEKNQTNLKKYWPQFKDLFYEVTKPTNRFRNVVCHADLWISNLMMKSDDCVLIDFQLIKYLPPALDLLAVLHLMTDRSTRLKYENQLIRIYYEELRSVASCVNKIYSFEDIINCIEYMKPQMIMQAATDCVMIMCSPEEISSFLSDDEKVELVYFKDRTEFVKAMWEKSPTYRERMRGCILDIYDYCNLLSVS